MSRSQVVSGFPSEGVVSYVAVDSMCLWPDELRSLLHCYLEPDRSTNLSGISTLTTTLNFIRYILGETYCHILPDNLQHPSNIQSDTSFAPNLDVV